MSRAGEITQRLTKVGLAFVASLVLYFLFSSLGWGVLTFLDALICVGLGFVLIVRGIRWLIRNGLWSLRNRLLVVYALIGVLPVLLLFVLVGLGAWALMNELAIYLASSALDRRLDSVDGAIQSLERIPPEHRREAAAEIAGAFNHVLPGITFYVHDGTGTYSYPPNAAPLAVPEGWHNVDGLLVYHHHFYGWCHHVDGATEMTALAPLTNDTVENLVPNLGDISLLETEKEIVDKGESASAGSVKINVKANGTANPDLTFDFADSKPAGARLSRIPPPVSRLDLPVLWPSTRMHYHLDKPGKQFPGVLWVHSRPSAVLRSFFNNTEMLRGVLFTAVVVVAILFLVVELVAIAIGVSLSRRILRAISQLYEGTRRVMRGDFRHRIPVRAHDQLGELAGAFNQMTGNLERLLSVEKEKERLQTELEIAREVQSQLYPKDSPPTCGLQLTVRCDPARMVSGDYYDYQQVGIDRLAFAIGDVAGKGISAALLMATLQAALRAQITNYLPIRENECTIIPEVDVAKLVEKLNKQLYEHTSPEKYATFFFALFDQATRTLTYTNAGHLSPLLFRNGDVRRLDSNGLVVGAFPFAKYDESCVILDPGDLLVCYTDGITEPENAYGEEFGEQRLIEIVHRNKHLDDHEIVRSVLDAVRSWTGKPELHDDMTLLLAREVQPA
jgi:sigma-B regulation protein RsbU (phosphoserine phosphatase)